MLNNFMRMMRWDFLMQVYLDIALLEIKVFIHEQEMLNGLIKKAA